MSATTLSQENKATLRRVVRNSKKQKRRVEAWYWKAGEILEGILQGSGHRTYKFNYITRDYYTGQKNEKPYLINLKFQVFEDCQFSLVTNVIDTMKARMRIKKLSIYAINFKESEIILQSADLYKWLNSEKLLPENVRLEEC